MKTAKLELTEQELAKVRECLDLVQTAQSLINQAASALCSVRGFANEWSASGKVYETIKRYWYRVDSRRNAMRAR